MLLLRCVRRLIPAEVPERHALTGKGVKSDFWPEGIALLSFPSGFFLELARKKSDIPTMQKTFHESSIEQKCRIVAQFGLF